MGAKPLKLTTGKDGLTHVARFVRYSNYETICGSELLLGYARGNHATCVACISGIVVCTCGSPSELRDCGYDRHIHNRTVACRCCDSCAMKCYENI